jgi:uncharacterized protein YbjT (DUF2867 family)
MRVAIVGGTGLVGSQVAIHLVAEGHDVVVVSRRTGHDVGRDGLADAMAGAEAVVDCAGVNREIGDQTYERVHVAGTRAVVEAARAAGARRLVLMSFLRARKDGPSAYHRSKWAAEETVRGSGLTYTIVKAGVVHGRGDHMLDHLSRAFHTFPVFGFVGLRDPSTRPVAVGDVARILAAAATGDPRLADRTVAVLGPETLTLGTAVRRAARVTGREPLFVRLPVWVHRLLAHGWEAVMRVPLVSRAQVEILAEGIIEPLPFADEPPPDLRPATPFSEAVIRAGLPEPVGFGPGDLRCSAGHASSRA